jgi:transposase-like protein
MNVRFCFPTYVRFYFPFTIHPTMFSTWLKQVLEAGREAFAGTDKKELRATERLLSKHKAEIERKNQIIAELTGEILDLKKELGDI